MSKENNKLFECALGIHEYTIPDKDDITILMCKHCKRFGHYTSGHEFEEWTEYDKNGNRIHYKNSYGYEEWFHKGRWVEEKPKNWKHEGILI